MIESVFHNDCLTSRFYRNMVVLIAIIAVAFVLGHTDVDAADQTETNVSVRSAWSNPAIRGGNGAAYFVITNEGSESVTLIGADAPVAEVVEIHETMLLSDEQLKAYYEKYDGLNDDNGHDHDEHDGAHAQNSDQQGTFIMHHWDSLTLQPGETVRFAPAGYHIMLIQLKETLQWGSTFPLTLYFDEIHPVKVDVTIGSEPEGE